MLPITEDLALADWELVETFSRASGRGGQNVNKVETAVELRFEAERSPHLS
ncbi:MAG: aminoacyl-tRNA hydrolase, partial [Rhodobacteraceae bacterium]|nr:aminoacyl-tRNA hydrolase [Paracoccaceae bacterium]